MLLFCSLKLSTIIFVQMGKLLVTIHVGLLFLIFLQYFKDPICKQCEKSSKYNTFKLKSPWLLNFQKNIDYLLERLKLVDLFEPLY